MAELSNYTFADVRTVFAAWLCSPSNRLARLCGGVNSQAPRLLVLLAIAAGCLGAVYVPTTALGRYSFHSLRVLRAEAFIVSFYAVLIVGVPIIRSLFRNELPIELTARGAKYEVDEKQFKHGQQLTERVEELGEKVAKQAEESKAALNDTADEIDALDERLAVLEPDASGRA